MFCRTYFYTKQVYVLISFCMTKFLKGIVEEDQWRLPDCLNDRGRVWWECLLKVGNCCWTLG